MRFDVLIVGGGPAGLALATALSGAGLSIAVVERSPPGNLAEPGFDGREIALTHRSRRILEGLGVWERIPAAEIAPLREARVLNGGSPFAMRFDPAARGEAVLGHLVPNHLIRRALYETASASAEVTLLAGAEATGLKRGAGGVELRLADGRVLEGRLAVAADTRFSALRRAQGIPAEMLDFGKTMLVCRFEHERPHGGVATEWFGYGQTIAMLPLNGPMSSAVLTLKPKEMARLMALPDEALGPEVARRYGHRLGAMRLASTRHLYPLVATYAARFVAQRFATVGDAAVGMHPVTAHGFNFGLRGAADLAARVRDAARRGRDVADPAALLAYESAHRRATWLLYQATNATARLYTDDRAPVRLVRGLALRLGGLLPPVRQAVLSHLMETGRPLPAR